MDNLRPLFEAILKNPELQKQVMPLFRLFIHSEMLTELVRKSKTPVDDMILRILRVLVPPE